MKLRRARLGKGGGGGAFFAFLSTERLSTTISEPGTGYSCTAKERRFCPQSLSPFCKDRDTRAKEAGESDDESSFPGGAIGYFLGGYVPPGTPNWHPVLKKISPKIDTLF